MFSYKASRYAIVVPLNRGRALAYNGMSGALAVWEAAEHEAYRRAERALPVADTDAFAELLRGGYVLPDEVDEFDVLHQEYRAHRFDRKALILTVAPTIACNFGCDYCFQGQDKPTETMSPEVQDAVVAFIERCAPDLRHVHIAWYGGEPLLRMKIIEQLSDRVMALCDGRGLKYDAMIVTNGYKLNAEVARSLQARRVQAVQITIDGDREYHDSRRHLLSGGRTYDRIVQNLKEAVEAAPRLRFNIRVNIDHRNRDRIRDLLDALAAEGLAQRPTVRLYFAPVEAMTVGCHSVEEVCMSKQEYGELEAELYRHAFERGLASLPYPPRFHGSCAAVRPTGFVITPTGDVHKCWDTVTHPEHAIGSIFDMDAAVRSERAQRWRKWSPFDNDSCKNCRLLPNCAGACAYKFVHAGDTRGEAAVLPCPSWKYNIHERLVLRAEKTGAITREDYDPEQIRTDPRALCTDEHIGGGAALPAAMTAMARPKVRLTVLPTIEGGVR